MELPAVWKGFQPYLGSLPGMDDVYTLYNFREEHIALLQDAEMVGHALIIHLMQGLAMFLCCMFNAAVGHSCTNGCANCRRALSGRR